MTRKTLILILASLLLLAGCHDDRTQEGDRLDAIVIPATVMTDGSGHSWIDGCWTVNDRIALQIENTVKMYEASTENGGQLRAAAEEEPFYWTRGTGEEQTVKGWYLGNGKTQKVLPETWAVVSNQSANGGKGVEESDFLYAPPTAISRVEGDRFKRRICFYHQTAKVVIRIKNSGVLAENPSVFQGITIGSESYPIVMEAGFAEPVEGNYGSWTPSGPTGYIIPHETVTNDADTYLKCYEALVIPQNLSGTPMLVFTINNTAFYYEPSGGEADLLAGHQFFYDVEVTQGSITVTPSFEGNEKWTWNESQEDVTSISTDIQPWLTDSRWTKQGSDIQVKAGEIPIHFANDWWTADATELVDSNVGDGGVDTSDTHWNGGDTDQVDSNDKDIEQDPNGGNWEQGDEEPVTSHPKNS